MHKKKVRLVHIFGQTPHHYEPMQRFFAKVGDGIDFQQEFWAWESADSQQNDLFRFYANANALLVMMKQQPNDCKFIFHGMFDRHLWPKLFFTMLPSRCSWVCWGADLYEHAASERTLKRKIAHFFHRGLIRRFDSVLALNDGDGALIQRHIANRNVATLPYPLTGSTMPDQTGEREITHVLLGNSANPSNEHIEALEWLKKYSSEPIKIIVPLSYAGPKEYIEEVIAYGRQYFGDKFVAITDMLEKDAYDELLAGVDLAVFAHRRQQGLYVVYSMLKYGKKMFMRSEVSSFQTMTASGFEIYESGEINEMSFANFVSQSESSKKKNAELMNNEFSEPPLLVKWQKQLTNMVESH